ncbi:hypothetical protein [Actinocorallia longicatena]|uniref:Uncharacterized protein n=1 Tax=Actinocorallia longicatena TaxID=111803 RepID=A0ABP6QHZ5_9ACTN
MPVPSPAAHRTVWAVDVEPPVIGASAPAAGVEERLSWVLTHACLLAGINPVQCGLEGRAGGRLLVLPVAADRLLTLPGLMSGTRDALRAVNRAAGSSGPLRLRAAFAHGAVRFDGTAFTGGAIDQARLLLDSIEPHRAVPGGDLVTIIADDLYRDVLGLEATTGPGSGWVRAVRGGGPGEPGWIHASRPGGANPAVPAYETSGKGGSARAKMIMAGVVGAGGLGSAVDDGTWIVDRMADLVDGISGGGSGLDDHEARDQEVREQEAAEQETGEYGTGEQGTGDQGTGDHEAGGHGFGGPRGGYLDPFPPGGDFGGLDHGHP